MHLHIHVYFHEICWRVKTIIVNMANVVICQLVKQLLKKKKRRKGNRRCSKVFFLRRQRMWFSLIYLVIIHLQTLTNDRIDRNVWEREHSQNGGTGPNTGLMTIIIKILECQRTPLIYTCFFRGRHAHKLNAE